MKVVAFNGSARLDGNTAGQMIIVGSSYWNIGIGREAGAVSSDDEGIRTMQKLGQNMAWLLKKLQA